MTTPATNTPYAIICDALSDAKKLRLGQVPSSELIVEGMRKLNDLINAWQTRGVKLFLLVDTPVTLVAGRATYTLMPGGDVDMTKPLRVEEAYYLNSSGTRRPLYPIAWADWVKLPTPAAGGAVTQYFVDKQPTKINLNLWLTPDASAATGTVHLVLRTQVTNPITLTETMAFPPEWRIALRWGLADEWSVGQPTAIMQQCALKAKQYLDDLEGWDVEDAPTMYQPDSRYVQVSRFR